MGTQSKLKKNMLRLILISIAGTMIYGLPYFRSYYYDAYLQTYGLTNAQMGMFVPFSESWAPAPICSAAW